MNEKDNSSAFDLLQQIVDGKEKGLKTANHIGSVLPMEGQAPLPPYPYIDLVFKNGQRVGFPSHIKSKVIYDPEVDTVTAIFGTHHLKFSGRNLSLLYSQILADTILTITESDQLRDRPSKDTWVVFTISISETS